MVRRKCKQTKCNKFALYGNEMHNPELCWKHKTDDMIKVGWMCECGKNAKYGIKPWKPIYCRSCKPDEYIDVCRKFCKTRQCMNYATYGLRKKITACEQHKTNRMILLDKYQCHLCRSTSINKKYEKYCARCFYYINPQDERCRSIMNKEFAFINAIKQEFKNMVSNKTIGGGFSNRRPDGLIKLDTYSIIIEIDEFKHSRYSCENKRIMEIFQDLKNKPLIVIRLNPDSYHRKSAFNKNGSIIKKEFDIRLNALVETIHNSMNNKPDKDITEIKLFFD